MLETVSELTSLTSLSPFRSQFVILRLKRPTMFKNVSNYPPWFIINKPFDFCVALVDNYSKKRLACQTKVPVVDDGNDPIICLHRENQRPLFQGVMCFPKA